MKFKTVSLAPQFHKGFKLAGTELLLDAMLHDEIRVPVERSLLESLLFERLGPRLPRVKAAEVVGFWQELRVQLDCMTARQAELLLRALGLRHEDLFAAIERRLRVRKYVDRIIARLRAEPRRAEAALWQSFLDQTLRSSAVRAAGAKTAGLRERAVDEESLQAARSHFAARHGKSWPALRVELEGRWGLSRKEIERVVSIYAKAFEATRACGGSRR